MYLLVIITMMGSLNISTTRIRTLFECHSIGQLIVNDVYKYPFPGNIRYSCYRVIPGKDRRKTKRSK